MKSVLNVQIGQPTKLPERGVRLPIAIDVTEDDSDDDDMPTVTYEVMQLVLSDRILAQGQAALHEQAMVELLHVRGKFSASGYERIANALSAYLKKYDITKLGDPYIPEPDNRYIH